MNAQDNRHVLTASPDWLAKIAVSGYAMPSQEHIDAVMTVVETGLKQSVTFFSEWGNWFAFQTSDGKICVVCNNLLTGKVQPDKPSKVVLMHLCVR